MTPEIVEVWENIHKIEAEVSKELTLLYIDSRDEFQVIRAGRDFSMRGYVDAKTEKEISGTPTTFYRFHADFLEDDNYFVISENSLKFLI